MNEVWTDVPGFEGFYRVSNTGRVKSLHRTINTLTGKCTVTGKRTVKGKVLRPKTNGSGYLFVMLCKGKARKHAYIHRLVADAFIPNPEQKPQVNHVNGVKSDNHVSNLEWVTGTENSQHAYRCGLYFDIASVFRDKGVPVYDTETLTRYKTIKAAAKAIGKNYSLLRDMLKGRRVNTTSIIYLN